MQLYVKKEVKINVQVLNKTAAYLFARQCRRPVLFDDDGCIVIYLKFKMFIVNDLSLSSS